MDNSIVLALVLTIVVLGGIFWLVVYSRKQSQKHTMRTSIKPPESQSKNRAARFSIPNLGFRQASTNIDLSRSRRGGCSPHVRPGCGEQLISRAAGIGSGMRHPWS